MELFKIASRHRVETAFIGAALVGIALAVTNPPLWAACLVEVPFVAVAVPWVMLGRRG